MAQRSPLQGANDQSLLEQAYVLDAGNTVPRDAATAAALYRAAAQSGDAFGHLRLGYLCETGDGVPQDYLEARSHYQAAADAGLKEAHLRLAICYLEGWGGPVDHAAFVREIKVAAEADCIPAQHILATLYFGGVDVPRDWAEGVRWLERAAKQDDALAQYRRGVQSEADRRLALMPDQTLARTWYQLSAEQDYTMAMRAMGRTFLTGDIHDRNWALGHRWLELAVESGDAEAPYTLAQIELLHPDTPNREVEQARRWLKLASDRGNMAATEVLELETGGRSLRDAAAYALNTPFEDRYVSKLARRVPADASNRQPVPYRVVKPVYPLALQLQFTEGKAVVEFIVDTTGRVVAPHAVKATHPLFGERAVEAIQQWRFHAGTRNGRLVNVRMQQSIFFQLRGEEIRGVDDVLSTAYTAAQLLGPEVQADAVELRPARPDSKIGTPTRLDGAPFPQDVCALFLLVLDAQGHPLRGHVLMSDPVAAGPVLLTQALRAKYKPRMLEGAPIPSNVVLDFTSGRFQQKKIVKQEAVGKDAGQDAGAK
ncbi:MAG: TonB family protein [Verrucomicrobia bacterium]|nr:TonB family protein [Verrucomicrobiota bacterium]